jgi:hypothetical protein
MAKNNLCMYVKLLCECFFYIGSYSYAILFLHNDKNHDIMVHLIFNFQNKTADL